ncbi:centromere protein C isoform X2 [Solanum dulcamara]|uniref:centromere protein C isoform X2 n=1 Tax=Solanum dulcamara TaxID=45834 RepID=UPI0024852575|nr:centromere protein C isoform X2 [Solanum dulcamara]
MVNEALISDPVDPLHGLAGLSLLPTTVRVSTDAFVSVDPKDLESIHNFMKSMEMKSPGLLEEARAIVDNGAELLNTKFTSFILSKGIDGDLAMKGKEKLQERRPGLGRKRARFSLKPSASQPTVSVAPRLDIDQLSDPVEFFSVAEKLEDAEKEIERQKGSSIHDPDVNNPPVTVRRRRPGILGKSVKYKHRFSSNQPENDDAFISSQETLEEEILVEHGSQLPEELPGLNVELQEADFTGSIKKTENRINEILDELLSGSGEDLDEDMAVSKLQERLQIKPIELGTLCIPEFPVTGKLDGKAFGERIQKPRKFSLEIRELVKSATEGTPSSHKQHVESPASKLASPTPPKSPFASLSLLRKNIMQPNPLRDPFSPLNIDLLSGHPDWSVKMKSQCVNNNVGPTESHGETETLAGCENTNIMVPLRGSDLVHEQLMEKNLGRDSVKTGPNGSRSGMEQRKGYDDTNVNLSMRNVDSHHELDGLDIVKDDSVINVVLKDQQGLETESYINCQKLQDGEVLAETLPSLQAQGKANVTANYTIETVVEDFGSTEIDQQVDNMPPETVPSAEQDHHFDDSVKDLNSDQLNSVTVEVPSSQVRSKFPEMSPQHYTQAKDDQQKAKRPAVGRRERKHLSSRPSLADAGTSFESGVRRSKRMKTRPLEYWKGERLLYGRVNEGLKLVGLKYISPGKGSFKVKSYIPDDYKDLVDLAARY